jgi:hypothetical protein
VNLSSCRWRSRIERGCILLNGGIATDAAVVLKPLDTLTYFRAPWAEPDVPNFVDVLFEDEDMVKSLIPVLLSCLAHFIDLAVRPECQNLLLSCFA